MPNQSYTLQEWLQEYGRYKAEVAGDKNTPAVLAALARHTYIYKGTRARLTDIDKEFCEGFIRYLSTAKSLKDQKTVLSPHTQKHYYGVFCSALAMAVNEGLLEQNPVHLVRKDVRIKTIESERVYLELHEVKCLMATPYHKNELRQAFLFSCFCGLRISDLRRLTWGNLTSVCLSGGLSTFRLQIVMKKTGRPLSFNLSQAALKWLPERNGKESTEKVFRLQSSVSVNKHIKQWAQQAGITKNVCFHSARHTFATLCLTLGADIYTTSKLLGHSNVTTTQIYARIVDKKKDEAMSLFDQEFRV